jgi:hypothetical protein
MDEKKTQSGAPHKPSVLEKYPYPEKLVQKLVGMLAEPEKETKEKFARLKNGTGGNVADTSDGGSGDSQKHNRDPGLEAHVLSEAVVAVATLAQAKPWRWRLTDVRSTSLTPLHEVRPDAETGRGFPAGHAPRALAFGRDAPRDRVQRAVLRELPDGRAAAELGARGATRAARRTTPRDARSSKPRPTWVLRRPH